jgi:exodeoxyribonuclease V alpha subunit
MIPIVELYYNEESVYGVYKFFTKQSFLPMIKQTESYDFESNEIKIKFEGMIAGRTQRLTLGTEYDVKAKVEYSKKYKNYNYSPISVSQGLPKTLDEQKKFLQSVCTPLQAEVLLEQYPDVVQMIVDGRDGEIDLNKTKGIKEVTFENIKNKVLDNYAISDILALLVPLGISFNKIRKLLGGEPNPTILKEKILDDPYILSDIDGISFKVVDSIAVGMNPEFKVSKKRIISFIKNYLKDVGESSGHTWVLYEELENAILNNIQECSELFDEIINEQFDFSTFIHVDKKDSEDKNKWLVGSKYYYDTELKIWNLINKFNDSEPLEITDEEIENGIKVSEEEQGFEYTDEQKQILIDITKNNFNLLTGRAGTGKSSVSRGILNIYSKYNIACATLSAKAAIRLQETSGFPAQTIHRLLGAQGLSEFTYNEELKLPYSLILLDEASMLNGYLIVSLLKAVNENCKIVMVGDSSQLPPIGYANVFSDILAKENLQRNILTKIHRQAAKSGIITDGNMIRNGENPIPQKSFKTVHGELEDMFYMFRSSREELNDIAIKTFFKTVEAEGQDSVIILTPRKKGCINSTKEINKTIQSILLKDENREIKYGDAVYKIGSKIINIKNDYDKNIMNGEIGYATNIYDSGNGEVLVVNFDGKEIEYTKSELKTIDLAWALSTHKFQGSQIYTVISIIDNTHFMLLSQEYLYTTISRAIKRCLVLAEPWAFDKCISIESTNKRNTWMKGF